LRTESRMWGCAVGAAVGDALGMPLEFGPPQPAGRLVREMRPGRLPAGTFTDDTEMALALAESLLARCPLDPGDLAERFATWYRAGPADVGIHLGEVLRRIARGEAWAGAAEAVQAQHPESAGNGSVMRCWPVALAYLDDLPALLAESRLQSRVTHPHPECVAGGALVNAIIYFLLHDALPQEAVAQALDVVHDLPPGLLQAVKAAPGLSRSELTNSGWVRHTMESAIWGLLTTHSFEEAVIQVVNLGNDADTAGAVVGALAGAAYGLDAVPRRWREVLRGELTWQRGRIWRTEDLVDLASRLAGRDLVEGQARDEANG
jgi:ADP-ribosyl-[dinitrogen reductase] hydrolase